MISNFNYCFNHPNEQIGGIYIGKNNLKTLRKICMVCVSKDRILPQQILTKNDFVQQLLRKSQNINVEAQLKKSNLKQNVKCLLSQLDNIQDEISLIIKSIKESILAIKACQKQMDDKFLNLINKDLNPFECSNSELDFLVNFLEGNNFEEWVKKKSSLNSQLSNVRGIYDQLVMILYKANHLTEKIEQNFKQQQFEETTIQLKGFYNSDGKLKQTMFDLKTLKNGDQVYLKDGHILRIDKNCINYKREQIIYNIEQLKHLVFEGQFGVKGNKIKQWKYFWKGKNVGGGLYSINGAKEGNWVDLCENYCDEKKILEIGYYSKGKRIGDWTLRFNNEQIGGGSYDQEGTQKKIGKWVELDENFWNKKQVTYNGEYNMNNMKIGRWDIMYDREGDGQYKQINISNLQLYIQWWWII